MKLAVATIDGKTVSQHFGQSTGFIVFDIEGSTIKGRELRTNSGTPHDQGVCHSHQPGEQRSGSGIAALLGDCPTLLCGGIGAGAVQALNQIGVKAVAIPGVLAAEEAVSRYLSGDASSNLNAFCSCGHHH